MKYLTHYRLAAVRVAVAALILFAGVSAFVSASSLPASGHTGQALALRAAMHPAAANAATLRLQKAMNRWQTLPNGRILRPNDSPFAATRHPMLPTSNPNPILISEGVQTFDLQSAPPNFAPADGPLAYQNLTPVWSATESFVVFSSNRPSTVATDPAGNYHIWLMSARGDVPGAATLTQVTSGQGNEFFPTLDTSANNNTLAFTSDANSPGNQNLYLIGGQSGVPFAPGQAPIDVKTLAGIPASAKTLSATNLTNVGRPTLSPGSDKIAFSAVTPSNQPGLTGGHRHIFYLFVSSNGYSQNPAPGVANPPTQLTDGAADDDDPAWSPDGNFIIFDSTATGFASSGLQTSPVSAPSVSQGVRGNGSRSLYLINGGSSAALGALVNGGAAVDAAGFDDFGPAWSFNQPNAYFNPTNTLAYISFARASNARSKHDIYYFQLTRTNSDLSQTVQPENSALTSGGTNASVHLNTDDPNNSYNDTYPSWSPFQSIFSIVYQSPRSVTYTDPATNLPVETAISLPPGGTGVGPGYIGLLESQVFNLDPPSLLRYNGNEVIGVTDAQGNIPADRFIQPTVAGSPNPSFVKFLVRLSNREAGIDDNNVYLQIKDPDSKYQDSQGLEHKVLAGVNDIASDPATPTQYSPLGSGTAESGLAPGVSNFGGNLALFGAVGGIDTTVSPHIVIRVGHGVGEANAGLGDSRLVSPNYNPSGFRSWGPEYECQYVNPTVADPFTNTGDYGVPYYLAGIDDAQPFSAVVYDPNTGQLSATLSHPARPTTNDTTRTDPRDRYAQWLPLKRLPDAQQDGQGGVLYGASYQTPSKPSDFYLDVIAYDKAVFPAIPANSSAYSATVNTTILNGNPTTVTTPPHAVNWRIYDNVGGFNTQRFSGANDILIVSDNALGQKFSFTNFGQNNNLNLIPSLFGAESYYTDIDVDLLPTAVVTNLVIPAPVVPPVPAATNRATPTQLTATPSSGNNTLVWAGITPTPTQYNIYRSTSPGVVPGAAGVTQVGTVQGTASTTFVDRNLTNGTTYYYVVTAVTGANETNPSNEANATPGNYGSSTPVHQKLTAFGPAYDVENGLGVNSYLDGIIDDGGRVAVDSQAGLPSQGVSVPYVRPQKYSLWRILSRGAVSPSVLAGYQPHFETQPAVADPTSGVTAPAGNVPIANRCVIWVSPYTGDLPLVDAGSLENPSTQLELQSFVNAGGRLCITGQNVASSISLSGNAAAGSTNVQFLAKLGVQFATRGGGSPILGGIGGRISGFSGGPANFPMIGTDFAINGSVKPSDNALIMSNAYPFAPVTDFNRQDASFDQTNGSLKGAVARIDTVTAVGGATVDMTTNGQTGLVYHEDYTSAVGQGFGSRVVFGSFGMEGLSIEYYAFLANNIKYYAALNQRPHILHNIVNYLRTGAFTGRITQANGQGVAGATVYVQGGPPTGAIPGPRQLFSATTGFDGSYTISGVEPGTYSVSAYKQGFTESKSNGAFSVEGDTTVNGINLVIAPIPPGRITGTVKDSVTGAGVGNVTVTFTSLDNQTIVTAVTGPDGKYTIDNVPVAQYNGKASKLPQYADATAPVQGNPITVPSGGTAPADFTITANPATVSGHVFQDLNGDNQFNPGTGEGISGATVTFTPAVGTAPAPVTSGADGVYSIQLPPGTYTISVSATGFQVNGAQTIVVQAGDTRTRDIQLVAAPVVPAGTLGGLVTDAYTGQPLGGVTVTIIDAATSKQVAQVTSAATATSPDVAGGGDGQPLNYGPVSLPPGKYNITASRSGFTTQTVNNQTVTSGVFTRVDFSGTNGNALSPIHVFPAGYNFFSVPYDYSSLGVSGIDQIFGTLNTGTIAAPSAGSNRSHLFVWSPTLLQYLIDPTPPADGLHLGQGYWVYLLNASEVTISGAPPTQATISVGLHLGWNQIGVPSLASISVSNITFANPAGGAGITFAQASSSAYHFVSGTLYGYNGTAYVPLNASGTLQPWQSYWIYAFADTTILLPTSGG